MAQSGKILYNYRLLITALVILFAAAVIERNMESLDSKKINVSRFQRVLDQKYTQVSENLAEILEVIDREGMEGFLDKHARNYYHLYEENGIIILGYQEGELKFWNSNIIPLQINESLPEKTYPLINPGNGWYAASSLRGGDSILLHGLILIKHDYLFENEFLVNEYHPDFNLFPEADLVIGRDGESSITGPDGEVIFSLSEPSPRVYNKTFAYVACTLYAISALLVLIFLYGSFSAFRFKTIALKNSWFAVTALSLLLIRYLMLETGSPSIFGTFSLFQPQHYAKSALFPSLGDFLINSVFILFIAISFSAHFRLIDTETNPCRAGSILRVVLLTLLLAGFMMFFHYMFSGLIFNSNIQMEVNNFFYLTRLSFIAYLILSILLASLILFTDRVVFIASTLVEFRLFIIIFTVAFATATGVMSLAGNTINIYATIFFIVLTGSMIWIRYFRYRYKYSFQVFLVLLVSVFTLAFITNQSRKKEKDVRQLLAVNLANERDQVAEFLLEEMERDLKEDSVIISTISSRFYDDFELFDYLESTYFGGYFRKYDLQIASCGPDFDLWLEDVDEFVDCYDFFFDMVWEVGIPVSANNRFYFLDNLNGRISYLGEIVYEFDEYPWEKTLFISIDSKLLSDQLGYPELLLEGKFSSNPVMAQYSHAKYNNNKLITKSGTYSYPLEMNFDRVTGEEFYFIDKDGYDHLVYNIDSENVIVMSRPEITTIDLLTSFSYNFVFFYLLYSLALLICNYPVRIRRWRIDFKNKIKFSMIGVLLLSLIIIGAGTVYYNIRQFENKQYENISEKIQSVLVELEYRLGLESELTPEMRYYITGLLIQLSNVFYTDINLYDMKGNLYASSRPEVFELGLIGEQMNPEAYSEMLVRKNARFVHKESISNLSYLSAYVPFTNAGNEVLSYLNLPYFTRQSILKKEIYTLVVAVVNIYAILILITILIAIIVSNTVTKPLQLIQNKLRELSIGKKNEQIDYDNDDEIGSLIKEYNRMVVELENSADMLARSERESAWREMAKQIAHEIKNPLTPMKLSIQHLQRAWDDKVENWDEVLKKTTRNLVDQIDHLSSIATAFSHFAKLPGTTRGKANIVNTITNVTELFANSDETEITVNLDGAEELYVVSDKMQLNRIFVNLFKNAIQAIPKTRKGIIKVELKKEPEMALVKITDNGDGIPPGVWDKMFTPYFTSKSGGTGLGLAIVKNIVEQSGGEVGFESEYGRGSCFWFRLPYSAAQKTT